MTRERAEKRVNALESRSQSRTRQHRPFAGVPPLDELPPPYRDFLTALSEFSGEDFRTLTSAEIDAAVVKVREKRPDVLTALSDAMLDEAGRDQDVEPIEETR